MSFYSRRNYGWGGFAPQMSVAELEARAEQVAARIAKKEKRELKGVKLEGRTIAKTFWGKAWCDNIETYRDYAYRLERGRKYVRSGSVIDLVITKGHVQALVVGSERTPYRVSIDIRTMAKAKWDGLVKRMTGKISSLMALAAGKLPKEFLEDFCNVETGLFPKSGEITLSCDCPDGAVCCKHVAAVLYGIGARLDAEPELFFTLRGVDPQSIISSEAVVDTLTADASSELASSDLGDVFGISLDAEVVEPEDSGLACASVTSASKVCGDRNVAAPAGVTSVEVETARGGDIPVAAFFRETRKRFGLTQTEFAKRLGTNQATISAIERGGKNLRAAKLLDRVKMLAAEGETAEDGSPVVFRVAERKDVALILEFIRELADYEKMLNEVVATPELLEKWIFDERKAEVIFVLEGEREVGFALFFHNFSTFLGRAGIYLEDLYVRPECRGKGYGKALLKELARIAVERGCGRLEWWCLDWNRSSIDFYLSLGAEPMKDWTVYRIAGETLKKLAV